MWVKKTDLFKILSIIITDEMVCCLGWRMGKASWIMHEAQLAVRWKLLNLGERGALICLLHFCKCYAEAMDKLRSFRNGETPEVPAGFWNGRDVIAKFKIGRAHV